MAMADFTMALFSSAHQETLGLIYKAQDASQPAGLVHKVVTALKSKYQPVDMVSLVEMRQATAKVSMKKNEEPSILFEKICTERIYPTINCGTKIAGCQFNVGSLTKML
jgi:hypothetical protein